MADLRLTDDFAAGEERKLFALIAYILVVGAAYGLAAC